MTSPKGQPLAPEPTATNRPPLTQQDFVQTKPEKKKRKHASKAVTLHQSTLRNLAWSYLHLQHLTPNTPSSATSLDAVTAHLHLQAASTQFLGLHGSAIPIDILKLEGQDIWIRVPAEDKGAATAAIGGWVSGKGEGWRVKGCSSWDVRAIGRDGGQDLFND